MTDTRGWIPMVDASKEKGDGSGDFGLEVWGYRHPDDHMPILSDTPTSEDPPSESAADHFAALPAEVQDRAVAEQTGMANLTVRSTGEPSREPEEGEEVAQEEAAPTSEAAQAQEVQAQASPAQAQQAQQAQQES